MNKDTDTAIAIAYKKELINKNISIDKCKECKYLNITKENLICKSELPNTDTCNLLKIVYG